MLIKRFENYTINKLIWIHGLPGSGKTHLSNNLNKNNDFVILDDITNMSDITKEVNKRSNIILSSPYFEEYSHTGYYERLRSILKDSDYQVEEIWFENNPEKCIKNLKNRTDHKIDSITIIPEIGWFSKRYKIPSSAKVIPVWSEY